MWFERLQEGLGEKASESCVNKLVTVISKELGLSWRLCHLGKASVRVSLNHCHLSSGCPFARLFQPAGLGLLGLVCYTVPPSVAIGIPLPLPISLSTLERKEPAQTLACSVSIQPLTLLDPSQPPGQRTTFILFSVAECKQTFLSLGMNYV